MEGYVSLTLPMSVLLEIEDDARQQGISVAAWTRQAIYHRLKRQKTNPFLIRARPKPRS
jgi:hypothetical protein